jgi:hypothetical protein
MHLTPQCWLAHPPWDEQRKPIAIHRDPEPVRAALVASLLNQGHELTQGPGDCCEGPSNIA